jgi:hypothetical protein
MGSRRAHRELGDVRTILGLLTGCRRGEQYLTTGVIALA